MRHGVQIQSTSVPQFSDELEAKLLHALREKSAQGRNAHFALELGGPDGVSLGGLTASTSYGWLLIKVLFVEPPARGKGYGRDLLSAAFLRAKDVGCHGAWLDTSDENAYRFYLAQGFVPFGTLANDLNQSPKGHQRWFMKRLI